MDNPDRQRPSIPNDSAGRYGHPPEPVYQGFHTYATGNLDSGDGGRRWPENWDHINDPEHGFEDEEPAGRPDYGVAMLWTVCWYSVPAIFLILRALLPIGSDGHRTAALADLIANFPIWLVALASGLILAVILRWSSDTWRSSTIGFCAAVVSGGAMTILLRLW